MVDIGEDVELGFGGQIVLEWTKGRAAVRPFQAGEQYEQSPRNRKREKEREREK